MTNEPHRYPCPICRRIDDRCKCWEHITAEIDDVQPKELQPGDKVRVRVDLMRVDGGGVRAGTVGIVSRVFETRTEAGIEPRVSLESESGEIILTQVRLDQIERVE